MSVIHSKEFYYDSALRNGFILPYKGSPFVTTEYLYDVVTGKVWCPTIETFIRRNCPTPPSKESVLAEVKAILDLRRETIGNTSKHVPPTSWLLECLSSLDPHHRFFDKNFRPPPKIRREEPHLLEGHEEFFNGLPCPTTKMLKKSSVKAHSTILKLQ